ncbi:MAG: LysR family transcriptional regulator [Candidatus Dasytiphilus stammeri]
MEGYIVHRTDLNLLRVLDMLLEECSVSKTAKKLNVTPPAISKSLNKIRDTFKDQILVRSGSQLMLTPLAIHLKPQIKTLIKNIQSIFNQNMNFNIGDKLIFFTIASNDLLMSMLSCNFMKQFNKNKDRPNIMIEFKYDNVPDDFLRKENVDLYIGEPRELSPEVKIRTVYREKCLIIANREHELFKKTKTLDNIINYNFISTRGKLNTDIDNAFMAKGYQRKIIGISPSYFSTIETVMHTDSLAVVPVFFLSTLDRLKIEIAAFEPEICLPGVSVVQAWHPRNDNSPAHKWLRDYTRSFFIRSSTSKTNDLLSNNHILI